LTSSLRGTRDNKGGNLCLVKFGSITVKNFVKIRGFLEQILKELETTGAKRVVTRLNSSDSIKPAPYFIGIVENRELVKRRIAWNEP
jgi:hypothetical protein